MIEKLNQAERLADALFAATGGILISFVRRVAPFATPAAPAFFFGFTVYLAALDIGASVTVSKLVGGVTALGLESAGIMASHTAVRLHSLGYKRKAGIATGLTVLYLVVGIAGVVLFESVVAVSVAAFLITGMVYWSLALVEDVDRLQAQQASVTSDQRQSKQDAAHRRQELKLERMRIDAELELARQSHRASIELAQLQVVPVESNAERRIEHVCLDCGRSDFGSVQAVSAHKRWCSGKQNGVAVTVNGHSD